jgi:twitching motility protein PilT
VPSLAKLELPEIVGSLVGPGPGLVLVTGGAGSGRTTTLASMTDHLGTQRACHVITVEDPVEILLKDRRSVVAQREVGLDAPSAAAALRAAARQDADVLVIGDLRDGESAELALAAVEAGRLVLAGVAARGALDAFRRVGDLLALLPSSDRTASRSRLAAVLRAVVALRLCMRADGHGRVPACELLIPDREVREQLRAGGAEADLQARMAAGRPTGSSSYDRSLVDLVRRKRVSRAEALARATDPEGVARVLSQAALGPMGSGETPTPTPEAEATVEDSAPAD